MGFSGFRAPSIHDFQIIKPISRGAFGKVFLGKKIGGNQLFAVKIVSKDEIRRKNLIDKVTAERDALAVSKCPYIVHLYYSLQTFTHVYLIMEYLIGGDLKTLLMVMGYLKEAHAAIYVIEIAIALEYLHAHGIIHRDLKPDNILINSKGHLKLTDFGLSTVMWDRPIQPSDVLHTPSITSQPLEYYRTPGQLISLTTELSFTDSPAIDLTPKFQTNRYSDQGYMPDGFTKSHQPVEDVTGAIREQGDSQRSDADSLASHLIAMLGEDAKERQQWRRQVLKAVENVLSFGSFDPSLAFGVCTSMVDPPSKTSVSLSEVVHEQSLLTLTELFADADPKELELIRSFVLKFSSAQLLRAGLLVRQSSLPAFTSPPFNNTSCQNGAMSLHTDALKSFGPMRRSKSHSHAEIHKPYRTRRGRRLYSLQWSPANTDDDLSSARRRATLPPIPNSPESDNDQRMEWPKENFLFSVDEVNPDISNISTKPVWINPENLQTAESNDSSVIQTPLSVGSVLTTDSLTAISQSSVFVPARNDLQRFVSPLRHELDHLRIDKAQHGFGMPCNSTGNTMDRGSNANKTTDSVTVASGESNTETRRKTAPDLPLSSLEKMRLQEFYSPARFSLDNIHGYNLAEIDPSNPFIPDLTGSSVLEGTPLRTPLLLRRQTHPCHFPRARFQTPVSGCASHAIRPRRDRTEPRRVPPLAFDSSLSATNTPLSIITESVLSVTADCPRRSCTVRFKSPHSFFGCDLGPCAPPSSPIVFSPQASDPVCPADSEPCASSPSRQSFRLMGTPDYLAPELLITSPLVEPRETAAVDWWALGIILFEMLTGSTPFGDDTPEAIFQNILHGDIPWPCPMTTDRLKSTADQQSEAGTEELSPDAVDLIKGLLSRSPVERMQVASHLRHCAFLSSFKDWDHLDQLEMPFVPCPDDSTDTSYFEVRNKMNDYHITFSGADLRVH